MKKRMGRPSRRRFLAESAGITAGLFTGIDISEAQQPALFSHLCASFDVDSRSAVIWVRGTSDRQVASIEWDKDTAFSNPAVATSIQLSKDFDLTHSFDLTNLDPDTVYYYRPATVIGGSRLTGTAGKFRTAPESNRAISFVVGADTLASYQPFRLFEVMLERRPEFFVHLGDTIYADQPNQFLGFKGSLRLYRDKQAENRADLPMQTFMQNVPTFATWDDHEVQDNFDHTHTSLQDGLQAFSEWWPRRSTDKKRIFRKFSWGGLADFFLLDTRQYRSPSRAYDDSSKTMLGDEQKAWLKDELRKSSAPLKIIFSPTPFNSRTDSDSWFGYRTERQEINGFIEQYKIRKTFVISADWHMAFDLSRFASQIDEIVVGPIAAWPQFEINPGARSLVAGSGRPYVGDAMNFGLGRVEPINGGARLTLSIVDMSGKVRFTKVIES